MNSQKIVGITGGIGAGKSIVCTVLNTMGYPVFYSDTAAKDILANSIIVREKVTALFGASAYLNNEPNRPFIAAQVFSNADLLNQLNAIIHPEVRKSFKKWAAEQTSTIVFNEAAILFETGMYKNYDATWLVTAPKQVRINRVIERDKTTEAAVIERMSKQWPDEQKIPLADYIVINDDQKLVVPQVLLHLNKMSENDRNI